MADKSEVSHTRVLSEHFARTRKRLLIYAEHVGLAEHGDVKGAAREGIIRLFLEENLPSLVEFKTGEIMDSNDVRSGQLDIVLQSIAAPRIPLFENIQITMADAALGVIEVKSNLTTGACEGSSHLNRALAAFHKVKALKRNPKSNLPITGIFNQTPTYVLASGTPCFLIAYKGPSPETLVNRIHEYGQHHRLPLTNYAPDIVCVLEQSYYVWYAGEHDFPDAPAGRGFITVTGDDCLSGPFVYICRLIEFWNKYSQPTPIVDYFVSLE